MLHDVLLVFINSSKPGSVQSALQNWHGDGRLGADTVDVVVWVFWFFFFIESVLESFQPLSTDDQGMTPDIALSHHCALG